MAAGTQLGLGGPKLDLLVLRKQERDPAKRDKVAFRLPAGGIGEDIRAFFALAEGGEERYHMPVSESAPLPFLFESVFSFSPPFCFLFSS